MYKTPVITIYTDSMNLQDVYVGSKTPNLLSTSAIKRREGWRRGIDMGR